MWVVAYLLARKVNKSPKLKLRLALVEKSVSQACYRFAIDASKHSPQLSTYLFKQGEEEERHFLALSKALSEENQREILDSAHSLDLSRGLQLARYERWRPVWVPAISKDYIGEFLFDEKGFRGLPLLNRLVVMALFENFNAMFYANLAQIAEGRWKEIAQQITEEEGWHQSYLWEMATAMAPLKARFLCLWWAFKLFLVTPVGLFYLYTGIKTQ